MIKRLLIILLFTVSICAPFEMYAQVSEKEVLKSIKNQEKGLLESFLDSGADIDASYGSEKTTLLNCAVKNGNADAVALLINRNANPDLASKGKTPLINAVQKKELMLLRYLINHGANLETTVKNDNTALIYAAKIGRLESVEILIENGADAEWRNGNGLNALDLANMANYPEVAKYLVRIIEMRNYYKGLPNYTDGPHIEWENDSVVKMFYMIYDTIMNYPIKKEKFIGVAGDTIKLDGFAGDSLTYAITRGISVSECEFENVEKILAIGDIHGHYCALVAYLQSNKVIDKDLNWIWGKGHLVFLGDVFDRGNEVTESLWFIYELDLKARKSGGRVHMLLGNHEVMVMTNDTRYLNRKYELFSNYFYRDYVDFFQFNSILGQWLRTRNTLLKINNIIFSHAGISPPVLARRASLSKMNKVLREYLATDPEAPMAESDLANLVLNGNGPLWFRGYILDGFGDTESVSDKQVKTILKYYKAEKMVIAHTEVKKMTALFDGRIIAIDVPIRTETSIPEALLIKDGKFYRLTQENEKIPCAFEGADDSLEKLEQ